MHGHHKNLDEPGMVAQTCNPSHSEGRDQKDRSSKPAPGK
jgi:hypothetical protein